MANNKKSDVIASISESFSKVRTQYGQDVSVIFTIPCDVKVTREDDAGAEYETTEEQDREYAISLYDGCHRLNDYKMPELQTIRHRIKDLTELAVYIGDKQQNSTEKFSCTWNKFSQQLDIKKVDLPVVKPDFELKPDETSLSIFGDLFGDDFGFGPTIKSEPIEIIEPEPQAPESTIELEPVTEEEINDPIDELPNLKVFVSCKNEEDKTVKKEINLNTRELLPQVNAWLLALGKKQEFLQTLKKGKHNALVLYPYPPLEWYVQDVERKVQKTYQELFEEYVKPICKEYGYGLLSGDLTKYLEETCDRDDFLFYRAVQKSMINSTAYRLSTREIKISQPQLRNRQDKSQKVAEIRNRKRSLKERESKESIPLLPALYRITPIKTTDGEVEFLTQTYLKKVDGIYAQTYQNIAVFKEGRLSYYSDLDPQEAKKYGIAEKMIVADGVNIFPDLSIRKIAFENLRPVGGDLWATEFKEYLVDANTGILIDISEHIREIDLAIASNIKLDALPTICQAGYQIAPDGWPQRRVESVVPAIDFTGYVHPNLAIKSPKKHVQTVAKIPKPARIEGTKSAQGSMLVRTVIGHTPVLMTVEPDDRQWKIICIPLRVPAYDLCLYLSDKLGKKDLLVRIRQHITELSRLAMRNEDEIGLLETLHKEVIDGKLPPRQDVLDATRKIQSFLNNSQIKNKSAYSDNYYRTHTVGYVQLYEEIEKQYPTYTLTVENEKDTRRTQVPTVVQWLRKIPDILIKQFGERCPSYSEARDCIEDAFKFRNVELRFTEKSVIELWFAGRIQTRQRLMIFKPVTDDRIGGKIPVRINVRVDWPAILTEIKHLLRANDTDSLLVQTAQAQIEKSVKAFVKNNIKRFVGEEKVFAYKPAKEILGFSDKSRGYGSIAKAFYKFFTPFTRESVVERGKFVNPLTMETYDRHDATALLEAMTNNWKHWPAGKQDKITLGGREFSNRDPGMLMITLHNTLITRPHLDQMVWSAFLDQVFLLSKIPIAFRCQNGVLLTPWDIIPNHKQLWDYRIKLQLIDIFYQGQREKVDQAQQLIDSDDKEKIEQGKEMILQARQGGINGLLKMSKEDLEFKLTIKFPGWRDRVGDDVNKHLQAMTAAYDICK